MELYQAVLQFGLILQENMSRKCWMRMHEMEEKTKEYFLPHSKLELIMNFMGVKLMKERNFNARLFQMYY